MPSINNLRLGSVFREKALTVADMYSKLDTTSAQIPKNRYSRHVRTPWIVTCVSWREKNQGIELYVNPSKISWTHGRRGSSVKTAAGTVRNVWYNHYRGTYYDEAELKVTFQSGNIMPFMAYMGGNFDYNDPATYGKLLQMKEAVPQGLLDFYRFKDLLNEPAYLGPAENRHIMTYHSRVFPKMYLEGFFKDEDPITWEESAEGGGTAGNTLNWNATFIVYNSYPRLDSASQMIAAYSSWLAQEGMIEALPSDYNKAAFTQAAVSSAKGKTEVSAPAKQDSDGVFSQIYAAIAAGQSLPAGGASSDEIVLSPEVVSLNPKAPDYQKMAAELEADIAGGEPGAKPPAPPSKADKAAEKVSRSTLLMIGGGT